MHGARALKINDCRQSDFQIKPSNGRIARRHYHNNRTAAADAQSRCVRGDLQDGVTRASPEGQAKKM